MDRPHVAIIAGPNGAGKSTAAPALLRDTLGIAGFVNADVIARGLSGFDPERSAVEAGRVMLQHVRELAAQCQTFAFETTLSSRSFAPWLQQIKERHGYRFSLVYLWLPNAELAVARVEERVSGGGHHVPPETVRRRYLRGIRNFFKLYEPIADAWRLLDNSHPDGPLPVAQRPLDGKLAVIDELRWDEIRRLIGD